MEAEGDRDSLSISQEIMDPALHEASGRVHTTCNAHSKKNQTDDGIATGGQELFLEMP
jgi:hypothetical protein